MNEKNTDTKPKDLDLWMVIITFLYDNKANKNCKKKYIIMVYGLYVININLLNSYELFEINFKSIKHILIKNNKTPYHNIKNNKRLVFLYTQTILIIIKCILMIFM